MSVELLGDESRPVVDIFVVPLIDIYPSGANGGLAGLIPALRNWNFIINPVFNNFSDFFGSRLSNLIRRQTFAGKVVPKF